MSVSSPTTSGAATAWCRPGGTDIERGRRVAEGPGVEVRGHRGGQGGLAAVGGQDPRGRRPDAALLPGVGGGDPGQAGRRGGSPPLRSRIPSAGAALRRSTHDSTVARSAPSSAAACSMGASRDSARSVQWSPPPGACRRAPRGRAGPRPRGSGPRAARRPTCGSSPPATTAPAAHPEVCRRCRSGRRAGTVRPSTAPAPWPAARRVWWRSTPPHPARRARWGPRSTTSCPTAAVRARARPVRPPPTPDRPILRPGTHRPVQHRQWRESSPTPRRRVPFRRRRAWPGLRLQAWRRHAPTWPKTLRVAKRWLATTCSHRLRTKARHPVSHPQRARDTEQRERIGGVEHAATGFHVHVSRVRTIRPMCGPSVTVTSRRSSPSSSISASTTMTSYVSSGSGGMAKNPCKYGAFPSIGNVSPPPPVPPCVDVVRAVDERRATRRFLAADLARDLARVCALRVACHHANACFCRENLL